MLLLTKHWCRIAGLRPLVELTQLVEFASIIDAYIYLFNFMLHTNTEYKLTGYTI